MKRIHLFEAEDQAWFPDSWRRSLTRLIVVMHKVLGTKEDLVSLASQLLQTTNQQHIIDYCSGNGGPMPDVVSVLREETSFSNLKLTLTDLYPAEDARKRLSAIPYIKYSDKSIDVTKSHEEFQGVRTMICSFHHMTPDQATAILQSAVDDNAPILIYEISDNGFPMILNWLALPINIITGFFITPFVKGLTFQQLFFTYIIPIIPLFFAWDGAVSNMRTYTLDDLDELLSNVNSSNYHWEKGVIQNKAKKVYLMGYPK